MLVFSLLFALVWATTNIEVQGQSYSRSYLNSGVTPTSHYYHHQSSGFVPLTYKSDLIHEETKHRSSKYSKKPYKSYSSNSYYFQDEDDTSSERYTSDVYSNEARHPYLGKDHDSREYTIGTHIRVQHPISVPKKIKSVSHPTKSSKYSTISNAGGSYSLDNSQEQRAAPEYFTSAVKKQKFSKLYDPDPFHVIAPPKSTVASHINHHSTPSYDVYEPHIDSYENSDIPLKSLKSNQRDRFNGVASKKQIEQYLEDQEKLLDEALKLQLLSSPKFQKLLKSTEKEHFHKEVDFEDEYVANAPPPYREQFPKPAALPPSGKRSRRRPPTSEFSRPHKTLVLSKPNRKYRQAYVIEV
ncbi:uncharacterized protein LOC101896335 isoform X1 [Musca domestica]|uniref:Uncharacterized protein LOC101896335 isoform X1 n=1 Tax=Musca domestica TaxID=7370 RepID=A0A9J7D7E3_MUSDO|nr:uncharacterized protein LOC101896335 isoform X1 [Musca domestica]